MEIKKNEAKWLLFKHAKIAFTFTDFTSKLISDEQQLTFLKNRIIHIHFQVQSLIYAIWGKLNPGNYREP